MSRPSANPPREPTISVEEAFTEVQHNGLLLDVELSSFRETLQRFHKNPVQQIDSSDVLEVLITHLLWGTPSVLTVKAPEGLVVGRDLHEGEEPEVQAELERLAAHFGVMTELAQEIADQRVASRSGDDDLLDEETVFEILGRCFARAGRPERIFHLHNMATGFALLLRATMHPGRLRLFQGEAMYRPEDDWRRAEPDFLAAHGVTTRG